MWPDWPSVQPVRAQLRKTAAMWVRTWRRSSAKVGKEGMPDPGEECVCQGLACEIRRGKDGLTWHHVAVRDGFKRGCLVFLRPRPRLDGDCGLVVFDCGGCHF